MRIPQRRTRRPRRRVPVVPGVALAGVLAVVAAATLTHPASAEPSEKSGTSQVASPSEAAERAKESEPAAGPTDTGLTVMTWNIHGESADIPAIAEVVEANGVDVLTVQEIHRAPGRDQVKRLADELGWYTTDLSDHTHFGPADPPGPCDAEEPGWAGNAVFTRYPIAQRKTLPLSPEDQDCPVRRSMAGVKLDLPGDDFVRVWTSHFTPGKSQAATDIRQAQASRVLDYLGHDGPLLFTGDVNALPSGAIHGWFVDRGWTDTGAEHADDPTHGDARIDYIFAKRVSVSGGYVVDSGLSDHRPLVIRMTVNR